MLPLLKQLTLAFGLMSDGHLLPAEMQSRDIQCIASTVYGEARGESELGQALVAQTIVNRVRDPRWPDDACAVVGQHRQYAGFSQARTVRPPGNPAWHLAVAVTETVAIGAFRVGSCSNATHFHSTAINPAWTNSPRMVRLCRVDNHIFYRELPHVLPQ